MYWVYILVSQVARKTYVGITNDPERRLKQHNNGYHIYTRRYIPWKIIYTEKYSSRTDARIREKYLKSASGRKWLRKHIFIKDYFADVAELVYAQS